MKILACLLLMSASAVSLQTSPAMAAAHASAADARAMLERAVTRLNDVGADKALAEFNQSAGPFNTGELYVFVFNLKGVYEAYGAHPGLVGTDVSDLKDAEGRPIVRDMIEIAKTSGHGRINYVWLNRADNRIEHKMSLIELVGDHVVGVGYYPG
ncbi:MAG: cache domain-containing protein [Pseudomonadota bacterium]|jgi:cytochrome c